MTQTKLLALVFLCCAACLRTYTLPPAGQTETDASTETETASDTAPPQCEPGFDLCGDECVDLGGNRLHCGECFDACLEGSECDEGFCQRFCEVGCEELVEECDLDDEVCKCRPGLTRCFGVCVDPRNDPDHCGECGDTCNPNELCIDGVCVAEDCPEFWDECDGGCTDTAVDALNCGACGRPCLFDEICFDGRCFTYYPDFGCGECPCDCADDGAICCFSEFTEGEVCVFDDMAC